MRIGVLTADCLPIIFYDTKNHVAACIHAGWRSAIAEIVTKVVQMMFEKFKFAPEDLQIYFGPCAKTCCYQVQPDFLQNLTNFKFKTKLSEKMTANFFLITFYLINCCSSILACFLRTCIFKTITAQCAQASLVATISIHTDATGNKPCVKSVS